MPPGGNADLICFCSNARGAGMRPRNRILHRRSGESFVNQTCADLKERDSILGKTNYNTASLGCNAGLVAAK
jgi:hypothetical protein